MTPVLAIFGPTASGKTAVAEVLARRLDAEVVSADAMQVYRDLAILTNQSPGPAHCVAVWPLEHEASVAEYARLAHTAIDDIVARGRTAIVVGGTGLYLRAAIAELDVPPAAPPGARAGWERYYDEHGADAAHARLAARDPGAAAAVHPNDRRRVVRALELADAGASLRPEDDRLWSAETRYPTFVVGLDVPKTELNRRIALRTRQMFERGVEDEVRAALARPVSSTARHAIGLREIAELPRVDAIDAMNGAMRRYAAYQRKWMRRIPGLVTVRADRPTEEIADDILALAGARERLPARRAG